MIRKFNYTGRKKIPFSCVSFCKLEKGNGVSFNAKFNFEDLGFPSLAKLYVEPYYKTSFMRFDFGTIENIKVPENTLLTEIPLNDGILFRVKVVDESSDQGLILGKADGIPLLSSEGELRTDRSCILPVRYVQELGDEIWKVDFDQGMDGFPVLEVNSSIPNIQDVVKYDKKFIALVYPAAIRFILKEIASSDRLDKDGDDWTCKWLVFSEHVLGVDLPEDSSNDEKIEDWVDSCVRSFCRMHNLKESYIL
jgi:hypothetical protein